MKLARRLIALLIVLGLAGLYFSLGYVQIEPAEQAIVLRLGRYVRVLEPGLRFYLPGIERIERERLTIQREEFGYRTGPPEEGAPRPAPPPPVAPPETTPGEAAPSGTPEPEVATPLPYDERPDERRMLTGDNNLVDVEFVVQWQIRDLGDFRFNAEDPRALIRDVSQSVVRAVVGKRPIDDVLFAGKSQIEAQATTRIQEIADAYELGVRIRGVQFQEVKPPAVVADAFRDLESAGQDKERLVLEAQGYRDQVVPQARGQADELIAQAEAYKGAKILGAEGEATRFSSLLVEYRRAPDVLRERLYLETLEKILPRMDKVIMDGGGERLLPYLPLERRPKP